MADNNERKVDSERLKTGKLLADAQWKADLSEVEKARYKESMKILEGMPGGKIRSQIQYIEKTLLPAVESRRGGKASPDYVFFESLISSLRWCLVLYERVDALMRADTLMQLERQVLLERVQLYEKELNKFTTLEDLYMREMFEVYDRGVQERLRSVFEAKKG